MADAYVSPIVLPRDRLLELKGDNSLIEMSAKCHISTRELTLMIENDFVEPTTTQLASISFAYQVPVLWLLGYHTNKEAHNGSGDHELLVAVNERNAIERSQKKLPTTGFLSELFHNNMKKRIVAANLKIASTAARVIAKEHYPLSETELRKLYGQPVFVEVYGADIGRWGISEDEKIHTCNLDLPFTEIRKKFDAYQMPRIASRATD